jgi:uncharacterized protein YneF (UPF0154 family)
MKKYTNKILIITAALLLGVFTISFFINISKIKKEIKKQHKTELIINH